MIYTKFVCLFQKHLFLEEKKEEKRLRTLQKIEEEKYSRLINEQHKYKIEIVPLRRYTHMNISI